MAKRIKVKMAEFSLAKSPRILVTIGLGSCIGIALYDSFKKLGGLIHIMLPENKKGLKPAKYADTGIPLLLDKMKEKGASKRNIKAKVAGGAKMFNISDENSTMNVGERNYKAVRKILKNERINIVGEDVGEDYGRTMEFYTESGEVLIKSYEKENIYL